MPSPNSDRAAFLADAHASGQATASIWSASINLANTIMGTGMLTLPYAFGQAGLFLGVIFAVAIALLGALSLHLLLECRCALPNATFTKVIDATFPGARIHGIPTRTPPASLALPLQTAKGARVRIPRSQVLEATYSTLSSHLADGARAPHT